MRSRNESFNDVLDELDRQIAKTEGQLPEWFERLGKETFDNPYRTSNGLQASHEFKQLTAFKESLATLAEARNIVLRLKEEKA